MINLKLSLIELDFASSDDNKIVFVIPYFETLVSILEEINSYLTF
jgi:hypothetical protein